MGRQAPRYTPQPTGSRGDSSEAGRRAPRRPVGPADVKSERDLQRAERAKRQGQYRHSVRKAYSSLPVSERKRRLRVARRKPQTLENRVILEEHERRERRNRELRRSQAQHDVIRDRDLRIAERERRTPEYRSAILEQRRKRARKKSMGIGDVLSAPFEAIGGQVKREVEGRGILAAAGRELGEHADPLARIRSGGPDVISGSEGSKIAKRFGEDIANVPAAAVPSAYQVGRAGVELAKGNEKPTKELLKDIQKTSPVYAAVTGDLKRAAKLAKEHPGFTALEVAGAKAVVGRGTGATTRKGGKVLRKTGQVARAPRVERAGEAIQRVGSTRREPRRLPGTVLEEQRAYSPDIITKGRQIATETVRRKRARKLRERATQAERQGQTGRAQELREKAIDWDPDIIRGRGVRRRIDETMEAREQIRRAHRAETQREVRKIAKQVPKSQRALIPLVAQRITRADKDDLRSYLRELEAEHPKLDKAGRKANEKLRGSIERALQDKRIDSDKIERAASQYHATIAPRQEKLIEQGLLDRDQAELAARVPYAVRRMGAKWDERSGTLIDSDGAEISLERIKGHMEASDTPAPSFVSQAPRRAAFNIRHERAQAIGGPRRTGKATREGTFDVSPEVMEETVARSQGLVDATQGFHSMISEVGARGKTGKPKTFRTRKSAERAAENMAADTGMRFRTIRVQPWGGRKEQLERLIEDTEAEHLLEGRGGEKSPIIQSLEQALQGEGSGDFMLIPEQAARQLQKHLNSMTPDTPTRVIQKVNQIFRGTVLSTSPTWLTGNIAEASLRTALAGAGPRSLVTGRKVLRRLEEVDPEAALEARARTVGGGHLSMVERQKIRRTAQSFEGTSVEGIAKRLGAFWEKPGPRQAANFWNHYTQFVFKSLNGRIESGFQVAMLGRALRDSPLMDERTFKLSRKAIDEAAQGMRNTNTQAALGRQIDRMYGKYSKWSPGQRKAIVAYTPFAPWWFNSVRFVLDVLPRDHPVATGLLATAEMATEEWRKEHGLDQFSEGHVPFFLQGSIPVDEKGGKIRATRYTPFAGMIDPMDNVSNLVLPQFNGALMAMRGLDWKGDPVRGANTGKRTTMVADQLAGAFIPAYAMGKRAARPETLNPFRVTAPPKKKAKRKTLSPARNYQSLSPSNFP